MSVVAGTHAMQTCSLPVAELGQRVGMSRSIFALKFKQKVGVSPMEYLTRWRMLLAGDRIANTRDSISEIVQSLGYDSASVFTKAFKKIMGCSVHRGNIAVTRTQFPLDLAAKRLARIGSNPSGLLCVRYKPLLRKARLDVAARAADASREVLQRWLLDALM